MLYTYAEAIQIYKNDYNLLKAIKLKKFFKIEPGIYSDHKNNFTIYELLQKKYPHSFLVKDSALFYIGFLSEEPRKIHLGTARNALRINDFRVEQHFYKKYSIDTIESRYHSFDNILNEKNIITHVTENQNKIRIFNFLALLYDHIRNKSKMNSLKFNEIIEKFKKSSFLIDLDTITFMHNLDYERIYDYDDDLLHELQSISWDNEFYRDFYY